MVAVSQTANEEQQLYPLVDLLIAEHGRATTTMVMDHVEIREKVRGFGEAVSSLVSGGRGPGAEDLLDRIRVLAYQLEALISLHLRKDRQVYLGIVEQYANPEGVDHSSDGDDRVDGSLPFPCSGCPAEGTPCVNRVHDLRLPKAAPWQRQGTCQGVTEW